MRHLLFFIPLFCLCTLLDAGPYTSAQTDEVRIELDDVKYALNSIQVDLKILDERLSRQDKNSAAVKGHNQETSLLSAQILNLEKKISHIEKTLDKTTQDLRTLSQSITQTLTKIQNLEVNLSSQDQRLEEVSKLKNTLTSISKAMREKPAQDTISPAAKTYKVKAGDSLEKISRVHHISVETLRKINHLANDKIIVGQELRFSDEGK